LVKRSTIMLRKIMYPSTGWIIIHIIAITAIFLLGYSVKF
jgi:hypothetical protein